MRRPALIAALVLAGVAACGVPNPVDTNDVSLADYKATLARIDSDTRGNLVPALEKLRDEDQAQAKPKHSALWWSSKVGLANDMAKLSSAVSTGAK